MIEYKLLLGSLAVVISLVSYAPYLWDIFKGKTKPHAFSWLIWTILTGVAFAIQYSENGGAGAWVTGISTLLCFVVCVVAFAQGHVKFDYLDWFLLGLAVLSFVLWRLVENPVYSIILVTLTDILGFFPTYRKAYYKPYEETVSAYVLYALKFFLSLFALETFIFTTAFYPAVLVFLNSSFVVLLLVRRKQISLKDARS